MEDRLQPTQSYNDIELVPNILNAHSPLRPIHQVDGHDAAPAPARKQLRKKRRFNAAPSVMLAVIVAICLI